MKILRYILFFLLCFLFGFFSGIQVASIVEAGKDQMLAGGAIVLGYGVVGAGLGLVVALLFSLANKSKPKIIILANKILAVLVICFWIFFYVKYQNREAKKNDQIGCIIYKSSLSQTQPFSKVSSNTISTI